MTCGFWRIVAVFPRRWGHLVCWDLPLDATGASPASRLPPQPPSSDTPRRDSCSSPYVGGHVGALAILEDYLLLQTHDIDDLGLSSA